MEEKDIREKMKILNGAKELFRKFGVRSITMDDIAHHLGISKKTIYQFFKDKDAIVRQVVEVFITAEKKRLNDVEKSARDAIHRLQLINLCLRESLRNTNISLIYDLQKYHPASWKMIEEFRFGTMLKALTSNLSQGVDEGLFRDDINVEIISMMRLEQALLPHNDQIFPRAQYSLAEIQNQFFNHFIHGILTEKGRKVYAKYKQEFQESLIE